MLLLIRLPADHGPSLCSRPGRGAARLGGAARPRYPCPRGERSGRWAPSPAGTTNPNRLRRVDRWLAGPQAWRLRRSARPPVVVDLGYGASPVTAVELHDRLRRVRRRRRGRGHRDRPGPGGGGRARCERPGPDLRGAAASRCRWPAAPRPAVVRAFNVLRQYDEAEVAGGLGGGPGPAGRRAACWSTAPATSSAGAAPGWR